MTNIIVDPKFKSHIRALKPDERASLEKNIIENGCLDPLKVWQETDILLDGHNRYSICTKHDFEYNIEYMSFDDREEALNWLIDNQLGRRNLTPDELAYYRGKKYTRVKQGHGGDRKSESKVQFEPLINSAQSIAEQTGTSESTIKRDGNFAQSVDKLADAFGDDIREGLLSGDIKATRKETKQLADMIEDAPDTARIVIEQVKQGESESLKEAFKKQQRVEKAQERIARIEIIKHQSDSYTPQDSIEIVHADCLDYLPTLPDNSIDLIMVDPPYYGVVSDEWDNDWATVDDYLAWCKEWMIHSLRVLKPTGSFYIWGGLGEKSSMIVHQKLLLDEIGLYFKDWITWKKARGIGHKRGWLHTREELLWYVKDNSVFVWNEDEQYSDEPNQFKVGMGGHKLKSEYKRISNVWTDVPEALGNKGTLHYTPKPQKALERVIKLHTSEGDTVLDFFAGSGSTGIASKSLGRNCILVEKNLLSVSEVKSRLSA